MGCKDIPSVVFLPGLFGKSAGYSIMHIEDWLRDGSRTMLYPQYYGMEGCSGEKEEDGGGS